VINKALFYVKKKVDIFYVLNIMSIYQNQMHVENHMTRIKKILYNEFLRSKRKTMFGYMFKKLRHMNAFYMNFDNPILNTKSFCMEISKGIFSKERYTGMKNHGGLGT
jgi:hypothetical protein